MIDSALASAIPRLSAEGLSQRAIAARLGVSRSTVQRYLLDRTRGMSTDNLRRPKAFKLDVGDQPKILELIQNARGNCSVVMQRLNQSPQRYGLPADFKVSYRSVLRFATTRFPGEFATACPTVSHPFHCEPGQQLQIDFVKTKFTFHEENGTAFEQDIYLFEAVYAWSRKSFVRVCPDMTQASWLTSIAMCLVAHGVPREILCDNDKCLVLQNNWRSGTVRFNPAFEWLCKPLGIRPRAARPARPQTKGRCERFGGYLQTNGLNAAALDRNLRTPADLQAFLEKWIAQTADQRLIGNGDTQTPIAELYEQEKRFLAFPANLGPTLNVTSWTTQASDNAGICIYGTRRQLSNKMAGLCVTVALRANGEYVVSAHEGKVIAEGTIPSDNMTRFKRDECPVRNSAPSPTAVAREIPEMFKDLESLENI